MRVWWRRQGGFASFGRVAPRGGIPVLPLCVCGGGGVGMRSRKSPSHGRRAANLARNQEPWRFLSREGADDSGVPGNWIDRTRRRCPSCPPMSMLSHPRGGYLISLCSCLFSCMRISEVLKKWVVFLTMEIIHAHCTKIQTV